MFDLVSPGEFAAGHSFFEAPPGTNLARNTSYVLVWRYNRGTWHRLQRTSSNGEDSGARTGASIANGLNRGADLSSLVGGTNKLEIAVYTEVPTRAPFVAGGIPVPLSWFHIPDGAYPGYQFRVLFVTNRGRLPTSGVIDDYNTWVNEEAKGDTVRGATKPQYEYINPIIRSVAEDEDKRFKAVACTAGVDARTNTGMTGIGVPVHWLDGGWEDRPTLVANSNAEFYGPKWVNTGYGAYVTGNSAYLHKNAKVWTGCDAFGDPHPTVPMGATTLMQMVGVGTPNDTDNDNHAPLGAVDPSVGSVYHHFIVVIHEGQSDEEELEILLPLYAISPIFTVVAEPEGVESDSPPVVKISAYSPPVVKISADSPLVPTGLRSRDRFRLIFLSSTQRNAESTDIADYNKFVQDRAAAGHADIRAHSAGFRAVACTEAVDALDNTGTNGIGLGIHWLGGAKAVDNYVDFYDGKWDEEVNVRDESGAAVTIPFANDNYASWTGCETRRNGRDERRELDRLGHHWAGDWTPEHRCRSRPLEHKRWSRSQSVAELPLRALLHLRGAVDDINETHQLDRLRP